MRKIALAGLLFFLQTFLFAQTIQRDPVTNDITNLNQAKVQQGAPDMRIDNPLLNLPNDSLSYDKISGSPFLKNAYQPARLYAGTKYIGSAPVKLNIATGEVYFLKDTTELVLDNDQIDKIIFKNDSSVFVTGITNLVLNRKKIKDFVQVLNDGEYSLIKYSRKKIISPENTSRLTKTYSFIDNSTYFIVNKNANKAENILKLSKESLLPFLPSFLNYEEWIKANNINLKDEKDVIRFLNYYNMHSKN